MPLEDANNTRNMWICSISKNQPGGELATGEPT